MEELKKKEFFKRYASKRNIKSVNGAAALTYLCGVISAGLAVSSLNYFALVEVVLIVGLALGIQIAKSRVCAVLLLIYSALNTILMSVSTGRLAGWLLLVAGLWAVESTFTLHKEYKKYLEDGTIPESIEPEAPSAQEVPPEPKATVGQMIATSAPSIGMFLGILILWLSISPAVAGIFVDDTQSPELLLQGYRNWYIMILAAIALSLLLTVAGIVISVKKGMRVKYSVKLMAVSLILPLLLGGFMITKEDIPGLISQASDDLAQIKNGQLQEVTVWLSPKAHESQLPGPYAKGQPEPVMDYGGISDDTNGIWVHFYVPNCLGFSLDQSALYNENESIEWNEENAQMYHLRYTSNFNLVVSAQAMHQDSHSAPGAACWGVPQAPLNAEFHSAAARSANAYDQDQLTAGRGLFLVLFSVPHPFSAADPHWPLPSKVPAFPHGNAGTRRRFSSFPPAVWRTRLAVP